MCEARDDGLGDLNVLCEQPENCKFNFTQLLEFTRLYRNWLDAQIALAAIAERLSEPKLMDDDAVCVMNAKRLD